MSLFRRTHKEPPKLELVIDQEALENAVRTILDGIRDAVAARGTIQTQEAKPNPENTEDVRAKACKESHAAKKAEYGSKLKSAMRYAGVSQVELASAVGLAPHEIKEYAEGKVLPSTKRKGDIADALKRLRAKKRQEDMES